MRQRFIWHKGQWVDVTHAPRPRRVGPYINRDGMDPLIHPATGELCDSKSHFRAITRAHGLVELGNDAPVAPPAPSALAPVAGDVADAWRMLEQGYQPPPVETAEAGTRIYSETE